MSFITHAARFSTDATATEDSEVYVLRREDFEILREQHRRLAFQLIEGVARVLAFRLGYADRELLAMQE
jgi:CRP-like cAMP-binding protein